MKRVVIMEGQDWQGLYIDGKLIDEDHELDGGDLTYMLKKAEKYKFTSGDIQVFQLTDEDEEETNDNGSYPELLKDFKGNYE